MSGLAEAPQGWNSQASVTISVADFQRLWSSQETKIWFLSCFINNYAC